MKLEVELLGLIPASPDEFSGLIYSTEFISVVIVNSFDMTYLGLKVALDGPVVEVQDEMSQRPFVAEDFIDRAHCGGVVRLHRQEARSAGVCQEVPCHYQKHCLRQCLESCNDAVTFDATLVSKTGRLDFPFRREIRDIELEREPPEGVPVPGFVRETGPSSNAQRVALRVCVCAHAQT